MRFCPPADFRPPIRSGRIHADRQRSPVRRSAAAGGLGGHIITVPVDDEQQPFHHFQLYPSRKSLLKKSSTERPQLIQEAASAQANAQVMQQLVDFMAEQREAFTKAMAAFAKQTESMAPEPPKEKHGTVIITGRSNDVQMLVLLSVIVCFFS